MKLSRGYTAGFFDAEGWVGNFYNAKKSHRAVVAAVGNTYKPVLLALQERWGGGIYLHPPYKPARSVKLGKPFWTWRLNGKAAIPFLRAIIPYLQEKRARAEAALAVAVTLRAPGRPLGSKDSYKRLRKKKI